MQAEGDVDGPLVSDALRVGDLGALELRAGGGVTHMDPADRFLCVQKVHGGGLLGASEGQAVGIGAGQRGGLNVLGVGDEQDGRTVDWDYRRGGSRRRKDVKWKKKKRFRREKR